MTTLLSNLGMRTLPLLLWVGLATAWLSRGEQATDLLVMGATVTRDGAGSDLAFVTWGAEDSGALEGRNLALYSKSGGPGATTPFERQWVVHPAENRAEAEAALAATATLGLGTAELDSVLAAWSAVLKLSGDAPLAERLVALVQNRASETLRPALPALASVHPAVAIALGRGWVGGVGAGDSTFELRWLDGGVERAVVGRVTVAAGVPVMLPAPGPMAEVPDSTASGDLNIRLRWATGAELRRRLPLSRGFNVWRVAAEEARASGWEAGRAVSAQSLRGLLTSGRASRVNAGPVMINHFYDEASVADFATDQGSYLADDHGRFGEGGSAFSEGSEWAYVTTARDLLGRDGHPSPAMFARACRTLGPPPPNRLQAQEETAWASSSGPIQSVRLSWQPHRGGESDSVAGYEVYRGNSLSELEGVGVPRVGNLVAWVASQPTERMEWTDETLLPASNFVGRTFWYAVRTVREGACGPLAGPMSGPVLTGLREHHAPEAPEGGLGVNCPRPLVRFLDQSRVEGTPPPGTRVYRLECVRRGEGIDWVEFRLTDLAGTVLLESGRQAFADEELELRTSIPIATSVVRLRVECRVGSLEGVESGWITQEVEGSGAVCVLRFESAEMGEMNMDPQDPLAATDLVGPYHLEWLGSESGGYLALSGPSFSGVRMLVQRGTGNSPWVRLGLASLENGVVVVDEPLLRGGEDPRRFVYRGYVVLDRYFDDAGAKPPCTHLARPEGSEAIQPLELWMGIPARAREYRLYRRTDDGPLSLIAQGSLPHLPESVPAGGRRMMRRDEVVPDASARLCYFAQVLDEHGNASPLSPLGCVVVRPSALPAPILARPEALGSRGDPAVRLKWFCPPAGIQRFEVAMVPREGAQRKDAPRTPGVVVAPPRRPVTRRPSTFEAEGRVLARVKDRWLTALVDREGSQSGPQFEAVFGVTEGIEYDVFVTALGVPAGGLQLRSKPSFAHPFQWKPETPSRGEDEVPWPARPLPALLRFNPELAVEWLPAQSIAWPTNLHAGAVGLVVGHLPTLSTEAAGEWYALGVHRPGSVPEHDPNRALLSLQDSERGGRRGSLFPAVLYREQVTNRWYPQVSGELIQVSPWVREVQWAELPQRDLALVALTDPFFAVRKSPVELLEEGENGRDSRRRLVLLDRTPVVSGARYRYSLVRFWPNGEVAGTVSAGEVEVP
ncbi:MAG: hypothetical protein IT580_06825 [Verrucomicrobiales bacterium]|nr:hypothetical protein [Verrucomicrobiales bacterium]